MEPLIRRIRNEMAGAEMTVENSKGECNLGQHEINFHYGDALRVADDHAIYKNGAKEIAAQEGMAITFIAKFNELGGQLVPHPLLAGARGRRQRVRRGPDAVRALRGRAARLHARADAVLRPPRQLLQALRRGLVRAHRGRLGQGQPHLLAAGGRATARRCGSRTACPART